MLKWAQSAMIALGMLAGFTAAAFAQSADEETVATAGADQPRVEDFVDEYELGPGDTVTVIVYQEPELSGEFAIGPNGVIALPLAGRIKATGLTTEQLADAITTRLADGYLEDANVVAEIAEFRPYFILGEVETPGKYPFTAGMTLAKAVATAGGFTYRAKKNTVYIQRAGTDEEVKVKVKSTLRIYPGDVVRIPERFF